MARVRVGVERAADAETGFVEDVGVDHRGRDVLVPEQFLDGANIVAGLEQVRREAVAEGGSWRLWSARQLESRA